MTWTKIDRDENGCATEECLDKMYKAIPFVYVGTGNIYVAIGDEADFNASLEGLKTDAFDATHYLPITIQKRPSLNALKMLSTEH